MSLRVGLYTQLAWVAFYGLLSRRVIDIPLSVVHEPRAIGQFFDVLVQLAFLVFPVLVFRAVSREHPPQWKAFLVVVAEFALSFAYFVAVLPAVQ
jgi:hypothetical protein